MLRDIPRIYLLIFGFAVVIFLMTMWYKENFERDSDVLQLNEIILTNAVTEVDYGSRVYDYHDDDGSAYMLGNTFESAVWERLGEVYPDESDVQFVYTFNVDDGRFNTMDELGDDGLDNSDVYKLGDDNNTPQPTDEAMSHMVNRPILSIEVRVKTPDAGVAEWTYVSSVTVDRISEGLQEEQED